MRIYFIEYMKHPILWVENWIFYKPMFSASNTPIYVHAANWNVPPYL